MQNNNFIEKLDKLITELDILLVWEELDAVKEKLEKITQDFPVYAWASNPSYYRIKCHVKFNFCKVDNAKDRYDEIAGSEDFISTYECAKANVDKYQSDLDWCNKILAGTTKQNSAKNTQEEVSKEQPEIEEEKPYIYKRVNIDLTPNPKGEFVLFGNYPTKRIYNEEFISHLNEIAGTPSTNTKWTSFKYFSNGKPEDFMWYIDVEAFDKKFRGVYFTSPRPYQTNLSPKDNYDYLESIKSGLYWFKYEPIKWRILSDKGEYANLICCTVLDSQPFNNVTNEDLQANKITNRYENSYIKDFLNTLFYNTAFTNTEKEQILLANLNLSLLNGDEEYAKKPNNENTSYLKNQKIFLPCYQDVTNPNYKFNKKSGEQDPYKVKSATDYSNFMGRTSFWWLRTPFYSTHEAVHMVSYGVAGQGTNINYCYGVCPCLYLKF